MAGIAGALEVGELERSRRRPRSVWACELLERFRQYLDGRADFANNTLETYYERISDMLAWLENTQDHPGALNDPAARDRAVAAYRDHLLEQRSAATAKLALAAIDTFYRWRGLGPAAVARVKVRPARPRTLDNDEQRDLLRAAADHGPREDAMVRVLLHNGLTVSQVHLLNADFLQLTDNGGHLHVHSLDGQVRTAVLAASTREALRRWLVERRAILRRSGRRRRALFISRDGRDSRLIAPSIDRIIRDLGREAGVTERISPGTLRYTFDTRMLECGVDPALVAAAMGLTRPNATRVRTVLDPQDPVAAAAIAEALAFVAHGGAARSPVLPVRPEPVSEQLTFPLNGR
ncbi:tyrosine-type recombinase/integrase [Nocardia sp. NBC_01730]|uniref:tyrosine-type recombinase/integrase n=1 Tax=Nocardia sp. NBC_01730 TaxID=2975998 RepID=UPI002E125218|nr:tyrosine-type recombinase/integrase [Nocardia sp. NBC_01730]